MKKGGGDQELELNQNCGECFFCDNKITENYIKCKNYIPGRKYKSKRKKSVVSYRSRKCNFISHNVCFEKFKRTLEIKGLEFKCPICQKDQTKIVEEGCYYKPSEQEEIISASKPVFGKTRKPRKSWLKFGGKKSKTRKTKRRRNNLY